MRVIAATQVDLRLDDLYSQLNVIEIQIPPLRERREDIPLLARHFIEVLRHELGKEVSGISAGALEILLDYHWPGNVRELENALERAIVTAKGAQLTEDDFAFLRRATNDRTWEVPPNMTLAELEK